MSNNGDGPRKRKHDQFYLNMRWFMMFERMHTASLNRQAAIKKGRSVLPLEIEQAHLEDAAVREKMDMLKAALIEQAEDEFGVVWQWMMTHPGLGTGWLPIRLLALIDDIERFELPSKLRRYCGLAVIDGQAERDTQHFSREIKSVLLGDMMFVEQLLIHRAPGYRELYADYRAKLEERFPHPVCNGCGAPGVAKKVGGITHWVCQAECTIEVKGPKVNYTPLHIYRMAKRPVAQHFLVHLWLIWRRVEGLSVTMPWILEQPGHSRYFPPPNWPLPGWEAYAV